MSDRDWVELAACRDEPTDIFFPSRGGDARPALDICALCPVTAQCLDWGLRHEHHGVFGGTSERERGRMRRARGITCEEPQSQFHFSETRCGTEAGHRRHQGHGETPCEECRTARNVAVAERRARAVVAS